MIDDKRYTIGLEFTGAKIQKHVLRFCGNFISACESVDEAECDAVMHSEGRKHNQTGWELITQYGQYVLLLFNGKSTYRVAYGADVTNHRTLQAAIADYGHKLRHALECEGMG